MKPQVSIIIPYLNDPTLVMETLDSVMSTIDIQNYEIILIDDGSIDKVPDSFLKGKPIRQYHHFTNLGVGAGFDSGVSNSNADTLFLMGGDVVFYDLTWASRMYDVVNNKKRSIVCTKCTSKNTGKSYYGADIMLTADEKTLTSKSPMKYRDNYRAIMQGKWRPRTGRGVYSIPSLMGAFYGVNKRVYDSVKGFNLHYKWGSLEPYISAKTWRLGYEVLVDSENEVFHQWRASSRSADYVASYYNQMMASIAAFGTYGIKYMNYLLEGKDHAIQQAAGVYNDKYHDIMLLATYVNDRDVMSPEELEEFLVVSSVEYLKEDSPFKNPLT